MTDAPPTFGPGSHLHLIDGSGFIFRAYHALPPLTRKSDGLPIGAVAGFCNMVWKMLQETRGADAPTHVAVVLRSRLARRWISSSSSSSKSTCSRFVT